jgi:hypothetical protein
MEFSLYSDSAHMPVSFAPPPKANGQELSAVERYFALQDHFALQSQL